MNAVLVAAGIGIGRLGAVKLTSRHGDIAARDKGEVPRIGLLRADSGDFKVGNVLEVNVAMVIHGVPGLGTAAVNPEIAENDLIGHGAGVAGLGVVGRVAVIDDLFRTGRRIHEAAPAPETLDRAIPGLKIQARRIRSIQNERNGIAARCLRQDRVERGRAVRTRSASVQVGVRNSADLRCIEDMPGVLLGAGAAGNLRRRHSDVRPATRQSQAQQEATGVAQGTA